MADFGRKRSCLKGIRGYDRRKEVEVDTLLLGNDKSNVIANYLLFFVLKLSGLNDFLSQG